MIKLHTITQETNKMLCFTITLMIVIQITVIPIYNITISKSAYYLVKLHLLTLSHAKIIT